MPNAMPLAFLLVAACTAAGAQSPYPHRSGAEKFECRNTGLERFAGRAASPEVGLEMLRSTGSKTLRWVPHGAVVTQEYNKSRVTIYLDAQGKIERASCG